MASTCRVFPDLQLVMQTGNDRRGAFRAEKVGKRWNHNPIFLIFPHGAEMKEKFGLLVFHYPSDEKALKLFSYF